jgi:hypothetical protein
MFRFNFSAIAMLFSGIFLSTTIIAYSDNPPSSPPASNDASAGSSTASSPSKPEKRPAPPPAPPQSAFDSSPAKSTDAEQSTAPTSAQVQPDSKPAANHTYPPQMLPDAMPDVPAWAGKDKDEPFDVKKFLESRAAPPDNAAPLYFLAFADIDFVMDFVYPPDQWQERLPQVKALGEDVYKIISDDKFKSGNVPLSEIEHVLKAAKQVQEKIDKAQQKNKCVFITGMRIDSKLPHLGAAGQICDLEMLQVYHASKNGNLEELEQAISRTFRLANDICPRGCLTALFVSIDLEKCILEAIKEFILDQKYLTTKECDRLINLLIEQQRESIPFFQETLRVDYIMGRNTIEDLKQGRMTLEDLRKSLPQYSNEYFTDLSNYFQHVDWQAEITAYNQGYSSLLGMADRPYYEIIPDRFEAEVLPKLRNNNVHFIWMFFSSFQKVMDERAKRQAKLSSTLCMIAVRKYELTHGKPPPYLSTAIAGTALKEIPVDPFTGKPMRYESDNKGFKILYGSDQQNPSGTGN